MFRSTVAAGLVAACAFGAVGGCQPAPTPSDAEKARDILRQTLDAWKKGDSPASLQQASPAVTAADRQWQQGVKLLDYEITGDGRPSGFDVQFPVKLSLQDAAGKTSTEKALYNVSTNPALVVVRTEPGG